MAMAFKHPPSFLVLQHFAFLQLFGQMFAGTSYKHGKEKLLTMFLEMSNLNWIRLNVSEIQF